MLDLGDHLACRDRGGVAAQDRVGLGEPVQLAEDLGLDVDSLWRRPASSGSLSTTVMSPPPDTSRWPMLRPIFPAPMKVTFILTLLAALTSHEVIVPELVPSYSATYAPCGVRTSVRMHTLEATS